jgi:hypothetical protein
MPSWGLRDVPPVPRLSWWVRASEPVSRVFCASPQEQAIVARVLYSDGVRFAVRGTARPGVTCVEPDAPQEVFAATRSDADKMAAILRHNRIECVVGGSEVWADATDEERLEMILRGKPGHGSGQERQRQVDQPA